MGAPIKNGLMCRYKRRNTHSQQLQRKEIMNDPIKKENGSIDADAYKGMSGLVDVNGMKVSVTVTDTRVCYGRFDLCVVPKEGNGYRWIDYKNVELSDTPKPTAEPELSTIREMILSLTEKAKAKQEA
jgi:hypothetical protein